MHKARIFLSYSLFSWFHTGTEVKCGTVVLKDGFGTGKLLKAQYSAYLGEVWGKG